MGLRMSVLAALLFGALISATDPVAVIALFREIKAPARLSLLMDAESLFNDATAIVMFGIVLAFIQAGGAEHSGMWLDAVIEFIYVCFGGILVGSVLGAAMLFMLRLSRGIPFVQIAHTTTLALAALLLRIISLSCQMMAVVAAGIITRTFGRRAMAEYTREYLMPYWEFMAFVANSFIFLLLGLKENILFKDFPYLQSVLPTLLLAVAAVLAARFLVIYLLVPAANMLPGSKPVDSQSRVIMFWGRFKRCGAGALMLSIPDTVAEKRLIIDMTLTVILFSLLIQGTTIEWLMGRLGIKK